MSKPWIFISPASRGIGHALARHLLQTTRLPILATARRDPAGVKASILQDLGPLPAPHHANQRHDDDLAKRLHVLTLDVTDEASVAAAAAQAASPALFPPETHHLHWAFALPGILHPERTPAAVDYGDALDTLRVNLLGPLMLMKHFGELLPRGGTAAPLLDPPSTTATTTTLLPLPQHATFVAAAARVGSTSDNRLGGWYTYRASKAGVMSATKTFDLHLRRGRGGPSRGGARAMAVAYHPGTVCTGLSRAFWDHVPAGRLFGPDQAAAYLADLVARRLTLEHRGRCWDWKGEEVLP